MQAIEIAKNEELNIKELVKRLSKLDVNKLEKLRNQIDKVVAYKKAPTKSQKGNRNW